MKSSGTGFGLLTLGLAAASLACTTRFDEKPSGPAWKGDVYTLTTCPVTGKKLGSMGAPVVKTFDDREVRFCCEPCVGKFEAEKARYFKQIDEQLIEQQIKHYPLTHCVVMEDDSLVKPDSEDQPVNLVYNNRLVRFCCDGCINDFKENPAAYIAKLDAAVIKQQKDIYPLDTCPVSGEKLGGMGEPVNYVVGVTLIRFCCDSCVKEFAKDPQPVLAKVTTAWKARHASDADKPH